MVVALVVLVAVLAACAGLWRVVLVRGRSVPPLSPLLVEQIHLAVADLLVNRGEPSPGLAQSTALFLARSGRRLALEEHDGVQVLRLRGGMRQEPPLRPFEELVVERIRQRMGDRLDHVPAAALGPGDGSAYNMWLRAFRRALAEEAVGQGLMRRGRDESTRLTPAGRRAARWWCRQIAPVPRLLPLSHVAKLEARTERPLRRPHEIWSPSGGAWHLAHTAPLRRPVWWPVWNIALLAVAGAVVLLLPVAHRALVCGALLLLALAAVGLWLPARRTFRREPTDATFRATVICRFAHEWYSDHPSTIHTTCCCSCCCSVEDPATRQAWTFELNESRRPFSRFPSTPPADERFQVGDIVEVHCNPRRRVLHRMMPVDPVPRARDLV